MKVVCLFLGSRWLDLQDELFEGIGERERERAVK